MRFWFSGRGPDDFRTLKRRASPAVGSKAAALQLARFALVEILMRR
jgi:hypothetical protein